MTAWTNEDIIDLNIHTAFIYEITNILTGEKYIGKKNLTTRRIAKTKADKAAIRGNAKYIVKESDWKTYRSSSDEVKEWTHIRKTILYPTRSKQETTYIETALLFKRNVLSPDSVYINKNIGGRYFNYFRCI